MQKVEESLREAQKNKKFKDSDIRIGGAKKEMAAIRKLTRIGADGKTLTGIDLDALSESERLYGEVTMIKFVKKDQVFPKFNVQEQLDSGVSSGAAFLKMKLRESFPNEPKVKTETARRVYIGFANLLYDSFWDLRYVASVKETQERIKKNFIKYFVKFILEEDKMYEDATLAILGLISVPNLPYRKEFENFDDAYDYLASYSQKVYDQEKMFYDNVKDRLEKEFSITSFELSKGLRSGTDDEEIHDFSESWCRRFENLNGKSGQLYSFIKNLLERSAKIAYITMNQSNYYTGGSPANHLLAIALDKMPELVDKHKRPLKNYNTLVAYDLAYSCFSATFGNFIAYLGTIYGGAQLENYEAAVKMEAVSPEESAGIIAAKEQEINGEIEKEQNDLVEIMKAKTITELDILWGERRFHPFGFYMEFLRRGRKVRDHAFYDKLEDNIDKWSWVKKYIASRERYIAERKAALEKFKQQNQPHPDDWSWAADYLDSGDGKPAALNTGIGESIKPAKRKIHSNPPLDFIERVGGLRIDKSKLDTQDAMRKYLQETFGFKAFELGASLKDEEAREIIYHFLGAISDFGDILNFDFAEVNRQMGLSMGFATRGSGSANAHYESLGRLINLTKSRGDGSVAHELGHYLDNILPALDHIDKYSFAQFASYDKPSSRGHQPGNIENPGVKMAMLEIMAFILYAKKKIPVDSKSYNPYSPFDAGKGSWVEYVAKAENAGTRYLRTPMFYQNIEDLPKLYAARSSRYTYFEDYSRNELLIYDIAVRDAKLNEFTFKIPSKMSIFYTNSARVGGDYWVRPTELFSRAFEVYVSDKLQAANRKNTFLCHGDYSSETTEYIPNYPYPQFEERQYLMGLFDNLFTQMKREYHIGDFRPFTTEKNEVTKADLVLSSKELSKARDSYIKKLKVLEGILTSPIKTIVLSNGVTVSYLPGKSTYRWKNNPQTHYTLKSITPDQIVLVDDEGDDISLLPDQFISRYELAEDTFAAGGKFIQALEGSKGESEFNRDFVNAYELLVKYRDDCEKIRLASGKVKVSSLMDEPIYPENKKETEEALTKLFNYPNWQEGLKKVSALADKITSEETFAEVREDILLSLANQMLPLFDQMSEDPDSADSCMHQIYILQLAIDVVSAVAASNKKVFERYRSDNILTVALNVIAARGEKFNSNKRKNDLEIRKIADEVEGVVANVYESLEVKDFRYSESLEKMGEEYEAHKKFGFDGIILDKYGRTSYHANELERVRFGDKKSEVEMSICQSPDGRYFVGMSYQHGTGGGGGGCWMSEDRAHKSLQDAYNAFFVSGYTMVNSWGGIGKTIIKQMKDRLSISEDTVVRAQKKLEELQLKEKQVADAQKAKVDAAIAEFSKFVQPGDTIFAYEARVYGAVDAENNKEPLHRYTVKKIDGVFEIHDHAREGNEEINLPQYGVRVLVSRPLSESEVDSDMPYYSDPDKGFHEQDLYFVVSNGKVHQARTTFGSIENNNPIVKAPLRIINANQENSIKHSPEAEPNTKVLFATKIGEPDYMEDLITEKEDRIEAAKAWAKKNGYDRFREANIDLSTKPNFTKTLTSGMVGSGQLVKKNAKTVDRYGVEMSPIEAMGFAKYLSNNAIAMNTKTAEERTEIASDWIEKKRGYYEGVLKLKLPEKAKVRIDHMAGCNWSVIWLDIPEDKKENMLQSWFKKKDAAVKWAQEHGYEIVSVGPKSKE